MFYSYFESLCNQKGVSANQACKEMGVTRSVASKWKSTNTSPRMDTLVKISNYFNVSIDELLAHSGKGNKKTATHKGDGDVSDSDIILSQKDKRFLEWFRSLSPEKQKAILVSQDAPEDLL